VKNSLVANFARHEPGVAPDGKRMGVPYYAVAYDFGLKPV
jgi:hydroxyquinol 1,2-dioxygenase